MLELAHVLKVRHNDLKASFDLFAQHVPSVWNHVDFASERLGTAGKPVGTYLLEPLALAAFLYWREHRGRLPRFFGVVRRVVEGGQC